MPRKATEKAIEQVTEKREPLNPDGENNPPPTTKAPAVATEKNVDEQPAKTQKAATEKPVVDEVDKLSPTEVSDGSGGQVIITKAQSGNNCLSITMYQL